MTVFGCSKDGNLNDGMFSKPLPWIGIYIAAASLLCLIAMAADIIHGIAHRKFWFPCKFFTLNSTSLTLIAVGIKLSVDLNTSMPRREDQLAKLSSSVLMCTVMGNSMPSLGIMEFHEMAMNIMALGILVITLIVNICIELGTGAIYVYLKEHVFIIILMLILLAILSFSAITVPTIKTHLEMKYKLKHEVAWKECSSNEKAGKVSVEHLMKDMMKYWMMARTCSPQFVISRSVMSTASGAICLLSAATLAEAILTSYLMGGSFKFCSGESDYKWSISFILVIQCVAVGLGTIAPAFRWFTAINFRCLKPGQGGCKKEFKLEEYWIQCLLELKDSTITFRIRNRSCRKLAHGAKNKFLDICICLQTAIVFTSKVIRLISIILLRGIFSLCDCFKSVKSKLSIRDPNFINNSESERDTDSRLDLGRFVLYLEGEDDLIQLLVAENCQATEHWIQTGKKRNPKNLINFLEENMISGDFKGIAEFDNHQIPCLDSNEPPNFWALPIVTLTTIAISLPNMNKNSIKQLMSAVNESLPYIRLVEDHQDTKGDFVNLKKAADIIWLCVDLHHKWLDIDLRKISHHRETPNETLHELSDHAKKIYKSQKKTHLNTCIKLAPSNWPVKILAANCMYRISQSMILKSEKKCSVTSEETFAAAVAMISAIIGACLTNLKHVISTKCSNSAIEEREKSVAEAAYILGKTEQILKFLEKMTNHDLHHPDQMACIDEWRMAYKLEI